VVDVGDRQAPDVVRLAVVPVDAPEADGLVADPQALDPLERVRHHHVALDERLGRADAALAQRGPQRLFGGGAGGGETLVRQGDVGLLGREVGMGRHRSTRTARPGPNRRVYDLRGARYFGSSVPSSTPFSKRTRYRIHSRPATAATTPWVPTGTPGSSAAASTLSFR